MCVCMHICTTLSPGVSEQDEPQSGGVLQGGQFQVPPTLLYRLRKDFHKSWASHSLQGSMQYYAPQQCSAAQCNVTILFSFLELVPLLPYKPCNYQSEAAVPHGRAKGPGGRTDVRISEDLKEIACAGVHKKSSPSRPPLLILFIFLWATAHTAGSPFCQLCRDILSWAYVA